MKKKNERASVATRERKSHGTVESKAEKLSTRQRPNRLYSSLVAADADPWHSPSCFSTLLPKKPRKQSRGAGGGSSSPIDPFVGLRLPPPAHRRTETIEFTAEEKSRREFIPDFPYETQVEVKRSKVAGKGVFSRQRFRKHEIIGKYVGRVISQQQLETMSPEEANKTISVTDKRGRMRIIDGRGVHHWSGYVNHKWRTDRNSLGDANLYVTAEGYFSCLREIEPGEELFIDYGLPYWVFQFFKVDIDDIVDTGKKLDLMQSVYHKLVN